MILKVLLFLFLILQCFSSSILESKDHIELLLSPFQDAKIVIEEKLQKRFQIQVDAVTTSRIRFVFYKTRECYNAVVVKNTSLARSLVDNNYKDTETVFNDFLTFQNVPMTIPFTKKNSPCFEVIDKIHSLNFYDKSNWRTKIQNGASNIYQYEAIYKNSSSKTFGPSNQLELSLDEFEMLAKEINFEEMYKTFLKNYWEKNFEFYSSLLKKSFLSEALTFKSQNLITNEGFQLAVDFLNQTKEIKTTLLNINNYLSTDIFFIQRESKERVLLYIPGRNIALIEFINIPQMKLWIYEQIKDEDQLQELLNHFRRRDWPTGYFHAGVEDLLLGISKWPYTLQPQSTLSWIVAGGSYDPYFYINRNNFTIPNEFDYIARRVKERSENDLEIIITSNRDVIKRKIDTVLSVVSFILLPITILCPATLLIDIAFITTGIAEVVIGIDDAVYKKNGADEKIVSGLLNIVLSASILAKEKLPKLLKNEKLIENEKKEIEMIAFDKKEIQLDSDVLNSKMDEDKVVKENVDEGITSNPQIDSLENKLSKNKLLNIETVDGEECLIDAYSIHDEIVSIYKLEDQKLWKTGRTLYQRNGRFYRNEGLKGGKKDYYRSGETKNTEKTLKVKSSEEVVTKVEVHNEPSSSRKVKSPVKIENIIKEKKQKLEEMEIMEEENIKDEMNSPKTLIELPKLSTPIHSDVIPSEINYVWMGDEMPRDIQKNIIENYKKTAFTETSQRGYRTNIFVEMSKKKLKEFELIFKKYPGIRIVDVKTLKFMEKYVESEFFKHFLHSRITKSYDAAGDLIKHQIMSEVGGILIGIKDRIVGDLKTLILKRTSGSVLLNQPRTDSIQKLLFSFSSSNYACGINSQVIGKVIEEIEKELEQSPNFFTEFINRAHLNDYIKQKGHLFEISFHKVMMKEFSELNRIRNVFMENNIESIQLIEDFETKKLIETYLPFATNEGKIIISDSSRSFDAIQLQNPLTTRIIEIDGVEYCVLHRFGKEYHQLYSLPSKTGSILKPTSKFIKIVEDNVDLVSALTNDGRFSMKPVKIGKQNYFVPGEINEGQISKLYHKRRTDETFVFSGSYCIKRNNKIEFLDYFNEPLLKKIEYKTIQCPIKNIILKKTRFSDFFSANVDNKIEIISYDETSQSWRLIDDKLQMRKKIDYVNNKWKTIKENEVPKFRPTDLYYAKVVPILPRVSYENIEVIPKIIHIVWTQNKIPATFLDTILNNIRKCSSDGLEGYSTIIHLDCSVEFENLVKDTLNAKVPNGGWVIKDLKTETFYNEFQDSKLKILYENSKKSSNPIITSELLKYLILDYYGGVSINAWDKIASDISQQELKSKKNELLFNHVIKHEVLNAHEEFIGNTIGSVPDNSILRRMFTELLNRIQKDPELILESPPIGMKFDETNYYNRLADVFGFGLMNHFVERELSYLKLFQLYIDVSSPYIYKYTNEFYKSFVKRHFPFSFGDFKIEIRSLKIK